MKCYKCGNEMQDIYAFCTECGTPLKQAEAQILNEIDIVKNKAVWKVQPMEVARKINEKEFLNLNMVSGVIIQPGVTALIYINGHEVSQVNSGIYNFVEDKSIKDEMDKRVRNTGVNGVLVNVLRGFVNLITGVKVNEPEQINDSKRSVSEIISMLNSDAIIAVYLKRDTVFPAYFGSVHTPGGKYEWTPMEIRTRVLDAEIGVHMFLKVVDFHAFITRFLLEKDIATFVDVQDELYVYVRDLLQRELREEDIDDYGISDAAKERISKQLKDISQYAEGVGFVRIAEITCDNDAFDRFRKLTQELWCSEKELDYLHRTNEFHNRIIRENNGHLIEKAKDERELKVNLRSINRDELLNEDEFEAFVAALAAKKFNRGIDTEIEKNAANTRLESVHIASNARLALEQLESDDQIYDRMIEMEKKKLHDTRELNRVGLDIQRDNDDYTNERRDKDFDFVKRKLEMALDIDDQMNEQEQQNLDREMARKQAIAGLQREMIKDHLAHEETMASIRKEYTAEQIMADKIDSMDAVAQAQFAGSFCSKKEEEIAKAKQKIYEEERERQDRERKDILDFARSAMATTATAAAGRIEQVEKHKDEYREDARYQQSRIDHTHDTALDYVTKNNALNRQHTVHILDCPVCGVEVKKDVKFCPSCGSKLV